MINKIYKTINNKFSRLFKFIFFLRYLFSIFFVALLIILLIPQVFDYKKKEQIIKQYLFNNYGLKIIKMDNIEFNSFPVPNLQINNAIINPSSDNLSLSSQKLIIYPEIFSIYNYNNFHARKIKLINSVITTDVKFIQNFIKNIFSIEKKFFFENLKFNISDNNNNIINLNKISFTNYGYKKNVIIGELFNKKFKVNLKDKYKNISFKLLGTGISAKLIFFDNKNLNYNGNLKGKVLRSNFKLDFSYENNSLKITNFIFRDKKLSFNSNGNLKYKPFFKIDLNSEVKNIDPKILKDLDIEHILNSKDLIKRFNSQISISFLPKKFYNNLIDNLDIKTQLAFGRLNINKDFSIDKSKFNCKNKINLLEDYPVLHFDCTLSTMDKRELYEKFGIKYQNKNEKLKLVIRGNLNILNNTINFDSIEMNENYNATIEDIKYFKSTFENILFDKNFQNIFDLSKLRKFILEIS